MKLDVSRVDVWAAAIKDRPGGMAKKLEALSQAGANLEFVIARRKNKKTKSGVLFVTPIKGARQIKAARKSGFKTSKSLHSLRVACTNKAGLGTLLTQHLAEAGINLRGFSGAAIGTRAIFHLAFDSAAAATKAMRQLKQL